MHRARLVAFDGIETLHPGQSRVLQDGVLHHRMPQDCIRQVRMGQVGAGEIGAGKVGSRKIGIDEPRSTQICPVRSANRITA